MTGAQPRSGHRLAATLPWFLVLVLGLGARLIGLGNPPLDAHHIRQSDTSSIAQIMCSEGLDLLHPRIHWAGADAGTVESELPLYAALTAAGWRLAGRGCDAGYVWPRSLSVVCWALGGLALALWVRRRLPGPVWPALVLYALSPLGVVFSRNIQPDALGTALLLWALLAADLARDRERTGALIGGAATAGLLLGLAIAAGGKAVFWAPLVLGLLAARADRRGVVAALVACAITAAIAAGWLWHANVNLGAEGATFGLWGAEARKWGHPGIWLDLGAWRYIVGTLISHTLTPLGLLLCAAGVMRLLRQVELWPWAAGLALGTGAMVVATEGFRIHDYYQLALVPFASVLAGAAAIAGWRGLDRLRGWLPSAIAVLLVAGVALSALLGARFVVQSVSLDERVRQIADSAALRLAPGEAVLVIDRHPQTMLFAMGHRGWHRTVMVEEEVRQFEQYGAAALLITDTSPSWTDAELMNRAVDRWPILAGTSQWTLFQLGDGPE